uniref:Variant surface glycoprotein 1125.115 n=1 Tax=Trypanosoma brucei TaxID=5691 RepID=A0A1J0R581_9TRYP|nr:variant surface glycoprotein 1125.115 [Trypanosoma brucei]
MQATQFALLFLLAATNMRQAAAAALGEGDNSKYFSTLCGIIRAATTKLPTLENLPATEDFELVAELVNLSHSAPAALAQIAASEAADTNIDKAETPANKYCKEGKTATCKKLAQLLGKGQAATHIVKLYNALKNKAPTQAVIEVAAAIRTATTAVTNLNPGTLLAEAAAALNEALEGKKAGHATDEELKGSGSRVAQCGNPHTGPTAGTSAGRALAQDALCLCAKDATANADKACGPDVTAKGAATITWGIAGGQAAQWKNLKTACTGPASNADVTGSELQRVANDFLTGIPQSKLTNNYFPGTIGLTEATPSSGCDGQKGGNSAACVFYGKIRKEQLIAKIKWASKLLSAADNIDSAIKARQQQEHSLSQIKALNTTLTALVLMPEAITHTPATGPGISAEGQKTAPMEEKQQECEKHKSNKTACESTANCKWKGTDETTGTCDVDETKVTSQKNAAGTGEQAGETAAATGCARHGTDKTACENDKTGDKHNCAFRKGKEGEPDLEKEMCRNDSFLVNNKFALSIAASSVSLVAI